MISDTCFWIDASGAFQQGTVAYIFVFAAVRRYAMIDAEMEFVGPPLREDDFEVSQTGDGFGRLDDSERAASDK